MSTGECLCCAFSWVLSLTVSRPQVEATLQLPVGQQPQSSSHIALDASPSLSWTDVGGDGGDTRPGRALFGDAAARLTPRDAERYATVWPMSGGELDVRADQPLSVLLSATEVRSLYSPTLTATP